MTRLFLISLFVLTLVSCNMVDQVQDMVAKQQKITKEIKNKYGWDVIVGWNINNGTLTQVTVSFESTGQTELLTVKEIRTKLEKVIYRNFDRKPQAFVIQFIS